MEWLGQAEYIKSQNEAVDAVIPEVCSKFQASGFKSVVLKGQGLAQLYRFQVSSFRFQEGDKCETIDLSSLRTSGDIDVLIGDCMPSDELIRKVCEAAIENRTEYLHATYHHCDFGKVAGVEVEAHWRASWFYTPWYNRRFQRFCNSNLDPDSNENSNSIPVPSLAFNRVYVLVHIYRHLFSEGIGLRQLMDYYMVLRASAVSRVSEFQVSGDDDEKPRNKKQETVEGNPFWPQEKIETMQRLKELGMERYTAAVMWVLGEVFEPETLNLKPETTSWMLCEPNEKDGRFLLHEIMKSGNFGHSDDRYKKGESVFRNGLIRLKRLKHLFRFGALEILSSPVWRMWHLYWWMVRHSSPEKPNYNK